MLAVRGRGGTIEQQAAAVLHDVLEDCEHAGRLPDAAIPRDGPAN
jgi:hypothetical protein